jgi:uncharacterized lipoprotein YddW (UPF0748 family)
MKKLIFILLALLLMVPCQAKHKVRVPVFVWQGWNAKISDDSLAKDFQKWKAHGVRGVCFNAGFDIDKITKAAKMAKAIGLEYHAWIPTMLQGGQDSTWYTVNRLGESAYDKQVYVSYYKTLDPHNPNVEKFLIDKYTKVCDIPEVDYIQLDYIRYVDVILARGLWHKYGLNMEQEYPKADYCYCDDCVSDFKSKTGIDIKATDRPDTCKAWAQFRCDNVTRFVNHLVAAIHAKGKKVSADVFPGPKSYAVWMVRQEWNKWNIDAVFPMNYNDFYMEPASWLGTVTKEEVASVANRKIPVYSGLFICHDWKNKDKVTDPEGSGLLPSEMEEAVRASMKAGARGVCLFTPYSMTDEHWAEFDKAIRKKY